MPRPAIHPARHAALARRKADGLQRRSSPPLAVGPHTRPDHPASPRVSETVVAAWGPPRWVPMVVDEESAWVSGLLPVRHARQYAEHFIKQVCGQLRGVAADVV